jgi:hypothetical protein
MSACGDNIFCCDGDQAAGTCNCENKSGVVSVPSGPVQTVLSISGGQTSTSTFIYSPSTAKLTSSPTPSTTSSRTSTSSPTTSPAPAAKKKPKTALIAGLTVAAVIVALIFAFLIWKWWSHTRRERAEEEFDGPSGEPYWVPENSAPTHSNAPPAMAQTNASRTRNGDGLNPFIGGEHSRSATPANMLSVRNGLGSGTTLDRSDL